MEETPIDTPINANAPLCMPCQLDQHFVPPRPHIWCTDGELAYFDAKNIDMRRDPCTCSCAQE